MRIGLRQVMVAVVPLGGWGCTEAPTEVSGDTQGDTTSASTTVDAATRTGGATALDTTAATDPMDPTEGMLSTTDATSIGTLDGATETTTGSEDMPSTAVVTAGPGLMLAVEDNAYLGTIGTMTCIGLEVPRDGVDGFASASVEVGLDHTFIGDLVIKLASPVGTLITLVSRPGEAELADDGQDVLGYAANISIDGRITFIEGGMTDAETMGSTLGMTEVVCVDDGLCEYDPNPGAAVPGGLSSLVGENSAGTWRFCVGDAASISEGFIDFVELTIEQVP